MIFKENYQIKDIINHATENIIDRVNELTHGEGVDIVYDTTYLESSFAKSIETVKQGGSWIVLGHYGGEGSKESKQVAERKAKLIQADIAHYWLNGDREQLRSFFQNTLSQGAKWVEEGKLKPYINETIN